MRGSLRAVGHLHRAMSFEKEEKTFIAVIERLFLRRLNGRTVSPRGFFPVACDRTAAVAEPNHFFASLAVFGAVLHGRLFGPRSVFPGVRKTVGPVLDAVSDRAIGIRGAIQARHLASRYGITAIGAIMFGRQTRAIGSVYAVRITIPGPGSGGEDQ